jgi:small subunit ribosomal protein S3e
LNPERQPTVTNLLPQAAFGEDHTNMSGKPQQISKKRKFVADGVFRAELNEFLQHELAEEGYSGIRVRQTPMRTEIIVQATNTQNVLGVQGRRIRELTSAVQKRFNMPDGSLELYAKKIAHRGLCAQAQAEALKFKLLGGLAVRRACYGVMRLIMEDGAQGCEVIVSGKLRGQRAKAMKFKEGYMIKSGNAVIHYVDTAVRHVLMRQGAIGVRVSIMLQHDPTGETGPKTRLPDKIEIIEPKEEGAGARAPRDGAAPYGGGAADKNKNVDSMTAAPQDRYNPAKPEGAAE